MSDLLGMDYDEFLSHHGVKGMRWGFRKENRPTDTEIRSARGRIDKVEAKRRADKDKAADELFNRPGGKPNRKAEAKYNELSKKRLKTKDDVTAAYMTKGERQVAAVMFGVYSVPYERARVNRTAKKAGF